MPGAAARAGVAALILGGLVLFLTGAGLASSLNAWNADRAVRVAAVAEGSEVAWRLGNYLLAVGVVVTAAGIAGLTAVVNSPTARAGVAAWLIAAAVGAVGFVLQGEATLMAAELLTTEGRVPDGFWPLDRAQEALLRFYGAAGLLASSLIGIAVLRGARLSASVGWIAVAGGSLGAAAILAGVDLIPAVTQLVAATFGVAVLRSGGGTAVAPAA